MKIGLFKTCDILP